MVFNLRTRNLRWQQHLDLSTDHTQYRAYIYSAPTLVDLNRDGKMEIIVGTSMVQHLSCTILRAEMQLHLSVLQIGEDPLCTTEEVYSWCCNNCQMLLVQMSTCYMLPPPPPCLSNSNTFVGRPVVPANVRTSLRDSEYKSLQPTQVRGQLTHAHLFSCCTALQCSSMRYTEHTHVLPSSSPATVTNLMCCTT